MSWLNGPFGPGRTTSARAATDVDRLFARRPHHVAFRDLVPRRFGTWDEEQQDSFFESSWSKPPHAIIQPGDDPCGYMCVEDRPAEVYLHERVIHPYWQGRGIGAAVLNAVIEHAGARGVPLRLRTHQQNRAANLYRRAGFQQIGTTDTHLFFEWSAFRPSVQPC